MMKCWYYWHNHGWEHGTRTQRDQTSCSVHFGCSFISKFTCAFPIDPKHHLSTDNQPLYHGSLTAKVFVKHFPSHFISSTCVSLISTTRKDSSSPTPEDRVQSSQWGKYSKFLWHGVGSAKETGLSRAQVLAGKAGGLAAGRRERGSDPFYTRTVRHKICFQSCLLNAFHTCKLCTNCNIG